MSRQISPTRRADVAHRRRTDFATTMSQDPDQHDPREAWGPSFWLTLHLGAMTTADLVWAAGRSEALTRGVGAEGDAEAPATAEDLARDVARVVNRTPGTVVPPALSTPAAVERLLSHPSGPFPGATSAARVAALTEAASGVHDLLGLVRRVACNVCRVHAMQWADRNPPASLHPTDIVQWTVDLHNMVNKRKGVPEMTLQEANQAIVAKFNGGPYGVAEQRLLERQRIGTGLVGVAAFVVLIVGILLGRHTAGDLGRKDPGAPKFPPALPTLGAYSPAAAASF
jgi:hypothetical protein